MKQYKQNIDTKDEIFEERKRSMMGSAKSASEHLEEVDPWTAAHQSQSIDVKEEPQEPPKKDEDVKEEPQEPPKKDEDDEDDEEEETEVFQPSGPDDIVRTLS